jgi:hypothetical protein
MIDHGYPFIVLDRFRSESADTTVSHVTSRDDEWSEIYLDIKILYPIRVPVHHQALQALLP